MTSPIWLVVFFIFLNIAKIYSVPKAYYTRGAKWPADNITPFPYETNGPINILTSDVKVLSDLKPLQNIVFGNEGIIVQNTGDKVEMTSVKNSSKSTLIGGPFGKRKYTFFQVRLFWSHDYRQGVGGGFDNHKGTPLFSEVIFYNSKYGSLNNSLPHRDGLAIINVQVSVQGHIPNPSFAPLEKTLKKLINPGGGIQMTSAKATIFLNYASEFYYAYPSVYVSDDNKYYYSCTTIMPRANRLSWISIDQFDSFLSLKNNQSSPVDSTIPTYAQEPYRPVIQGPTLLLESVYL